MTAATFVAVTALAWVILIAIIVAIFHGARWIDKAVEEEMDSTFSVRGGALGPPGRGATREG